MKSKQWIIRFIILSMITIGIMGMINFIIDPMQQYRKASFYNPRFANERYLNPGLAKNYEYNEVIIGTSMTENFIMSDASKYLDFKKPIKFCMSGTTAYEMHLMLETAYQYKDIDAIVYGLDIFSFTGKTTRTFGKNSMPLHLYDTNYMNDYKYLLNYDTFKFVLESIIESKMPKHAHKFDYKHLYEWQYEHSDSEYDEKKILAIWKKQTGFGKDYKKASFEYDKLITNFNVNLLPIIKQHPETTFYIFYPPYSILAYKQMDKQGYIPTLIKFKQYIFTNLHQYKNVKLFDFQSENNITCNLNNYKDFTHYHQHINTWILQQMGKDNYRVKDKNRLDAFNKKHIKEIKKYLIK